ncbi:type 1 periplasmic binding fold superfamily protein [Algibacter marinivivus]|uniref:Type 1 periplasmic binding fold superfamily protein n=1 Tax=Algibacter marinivivus TaxID=2100723 RepID=A0A2U2X185_9FLAO|nr:type 1 periplasmic binding fold superfamily protein [Algibacter marinivivus]PWH81545.1 type 1 periplasmic binding fold superfamily protein [Algibacter marinivivus]
MKTIKLLALLFISTLAISCSNDDDGHGDDHDSEEELITTVVYTLTNNADNTDVVTLTFTDLDGEGGADGTYDISGPLTANATYTGGIKLWNATENPAEDITEEVEGEADEHEFFYSNTAGLTITKTDVDGNGNPVGIETTIATGSAATGSITVILKHEPTKPNNGTSSDAGGSTDVEVTFSIEVQ